MGIGGGGDKKRKATSDTDSKTQMTFVVLASSGNSELSRDGNLHGAGMSHATTNEKRNI